MLRRRRRACTGRNRNDRPAQTRRHSQGEQSPQYHGCGPGVPTRTRRPQRGLGELQSVEHRGDCCPELDLSLGRVSLAILLRPHRRGRSFRPTPNPVCLQRLEPGRPLMALDLRSAVRNAEGRRSGIPKLSSAHPCPDNQSWFTASSRPRGPNRRLSGKCRFALPGCRADRPIIPATSDPDRLAVSDRARRPRPPSSTRHYAVPSA